MQEISVKSGESLGAVLAGIKPHTRVILGEGEFREKIEISVPDVEIIGQGAGKTRIVFDDYAKKIDEQGREYVTFRTYTAAILAPRVALRNLTLENDAKFPEKKGQEVALTVYADEFLALCDEAARENAPEKVAKRLSYGEQCSWTERVRQMEDVLYKKGVLHETPEK